MPVYDYYCPECHKVERDIKYKMAEKPPFILCEACGTDMVQAVAKLRFSLTGNGWYEQGYGLTDMESRQNLDYEKRVEDYAMTMSEKDKTTSKQG